MLQPWFNDLRKDYRLVLLVAVDLPFMLDFLADILGHRCVQIPICAAQRGFRRNSIPLAHANPNPNPNQRNR